MCKCVRLYKIVFKLIHPPFRMHHSSLNKYAYIIIAPRLHNFMQEKHASYGLYMYERNVQNHFLSCLANVPLTAHVTHQNLTIRLKDFTSEIRRPRFVRFE